MRRRLAAIGLCAVLLSSCASTGPAACPAGQEARTQVQLFFGRNIGGRAGVSDTDFQAFVDEELAPRFSDGLTIADAAGHWRGADQVTVREATKIVMVILPPGDDGRAKLDAARAAYKRRFSQEAVLQVAQGVCVAF